MTRYQQLLEDYARLAGLEPAELAVNQELRIADLAVGLSAEGSQDEGNVVIFTSLGPPAPQLPQERLMRLMLEANALWVGTGGCTLGLQAGTGAALLSARLPLVQCGAQALSGALDGFVDVALLWREVLQGRHSVDLPALAA
ncbi:type III secretion system chaperone [Bordetella genomosp. 1]|uniref:Tir chaperone family protein n=1 Tax=Bordetella genomosp. 1 TaxID=1395607 RepID=A0ABX4F4J3_9BORD|nr:type III secretion system chaperone [Bordetella genomosp. 1]OZI68633.1 hypothetical protein CAL27_03985 [Bordetella genomosp. 1]